MDELAARGYRATDVAAIAALYNAVDEYAGGRPTYVESEVRALLDTFVRDPDTDSRLIVAPDGTLVAAGFVPIPPAGGHRVDLWGCVLPGWRGRGIGREMLAWQLSRAAELRARHAPGAPWEAHVGALVDDEDAARLHARFGLAPARYWLDMVAELSAVPGLPLPDGLRVAPYRPDLEKAVHEAHSEAFGDHWGYQRRSLDDWASVTVRSDAFLPELSVVGLDGDEVAGYVLGYRSASPDELYVGHVGTRRPWRGRGLATALLAHVLNLAAPAGYRTASLGVDADSLTGAVGIYERVGFALDKRAVTRVRPVD